MMAADVSYLKHGTKYKQFKSGIGSKYALRHSVSVEVIWVVLDCVEGWGKYLYAISHGASKWSELTFVII